MEEQDTQQPTPEEARTDDRNDELDQSPAPDPEDKQPGAEDDPTAD